MPRNEKQTCQEIIEPALINAGWGFDREVEIGLGRINLSKYQMYDPTQRIIADYVLRLSQMPLAIMEAKAEDKLAADGIQQGSRYAQLLGLWFSIASNSSSYILTDNQTGDWERLTVIPTPGDILTRLGRASTGWKRGDLYLRIPGMRIRLRDSGCASTRKWRSRKPFIVFSGVITFLCKFRFLNGKSRVSAYPPLIF